MSPSQRYRALRTLLVRPELTLLNAASFPVILSFVGMYAALGPLLQTHFALDDTGVLLVRSRRTPGPIAGPGCRLARRTLRRHSSRGRGVPDRRGRTRRGSHFSGSPVGAGHFQRDLCAWRGHDRAGDHRAGR